MNYFDVQRWPGLERWCGWREQGWEGVQAHPGRAFDQGHPWEPQTEVCIKVAYRNLFWNHKWDQPPLATDTNAVSALSTTWQHNVKTTSGAGFFKCFFWRWYAGASIEFETNKGRVISFHPYLATRFERMSKFILCLKMTIPRQKDKEVTIRASPGQEIIMLKIK